MATFTKSLEQAISQAFKFATEKKHQYVTLEHLLLALTDETDARNVMKACNVDVDLLNENLEFYIDNELDNIVTSDSKLEPQSKTKANNQDSRVDVTLIKERYTKVLSL